MMELGTILAGFGGQGLLFAGRVLAELAMTEGREVLWIPSYGPEMRGGTASCTVIIADEPIGSPVVDRLDHAVVLNPPSLAKYLPLLVPGGLLVVNDSLVEAAVGRTDIEVVRVPCTTLAREAGDDRLVSVVALGALVGRRPIVSPEALERALDHVLGAHHAEALEADLAAVRAGMAAARSAAVGTTAARAAAAPAPAGVE